MKIYATEIPTVWEEYTKLPWSESEAYFESNRAANEKAVRDIGYRGKYTGEIVRTGVADGYATYMVMDDQRTLSLMHMDWVDGYEFQWAHRWTKKDILDMIARSKAMAKLFSK